MKITMNNNEALSAAKLYRKWLCECESTKSPHTIRGYKTSMSLFISYLEETGLTARNFKIYDAFCRSTLINWLDWLTKKGSSAETCNNRLAHIREFISYLADIDLVYVELLGEAKSIKHRRCIKKKQRVLSKDELKLLFEIPDTTTVSGIIDILIMSFLYGTAVRIGEMLSVQLKDLHMTGKEPYVFILGKGNKERMVYLPSKLVMNIKAFIQNRYGVCPSQETYLFCSRVKGENSPMTEAAVDKRLKAIARKAHDKDSNFPPTLHAHQFRRARATHLSEAGLVPYQIAKILGHENIETTMKYVDVSITKKEQDLMNLESGQSKALSPKWKKQCSLSDYFKITPH